MALVALANRGGVVVSPFGHYPLVPTTAILATANLAGESGAFIGRVALTSGPGTSKTISSAGGKIWFLTGTTTWATAGTTLRVGLQDVNAGTGVEDGTFDVFDDLVQGVDALSTDLIKEVTLSSGTKTIAHGDLIAVVIEMTVRNGADSVVIRDLAQPSNFPYCTADSGAGPTKIAAAPHCVLLCDDGTVGHFGEWTIPFTESSQALNSGSTPDEYAAVFSVPFACAVDGLLVRLGDVDAGETATVHLLQDPLGAVTNLQTATLDPVLQAQAAVTIANTVIDIPETVLAAGTTYAVSYRPTSAGSRLVQLVTLAHANLRLASAGQFLGASRTDLGAFATSATVVPDLGVRISKIDAGGGGGATAVAYVG